MRKGFLKPTAVKLVFLAQWAVFMLVMVARGQLKTWHQLLVVTYPLAVFYLLACAFALLSQRTRWLARGWRLLALAFSLTGVDQLAKALVVTSIPFQASVPLIAGWLHLAHLYNPHGSWVFSMLNWQGWGTGLLAIVVLFTLFCSILLHRYYITTRRPSVWADLAFVGLFAGSTSWLWDMVVRGHIVDFVVLPGVVAADLKDLFVDLAAAAVCAELLDNPTISLRPRDWRQDGTGRTSDRPGDP
jgi:lipoprotein signal peptidase